MAAECSTDSVWTKWQQSTAKVSLEGVGVMVRMVSCHKWHNWPPRRMVDWIVKDTEMPSASSDSIMAFPGSSFASMDAPPQQAEMALAGDPSPHKNKRLSIFLRCDTVNCLFPPS